MDEVSDGTAHDESGSAVYFDGKSSRRRIVRLAFASALEIMEEGALPVRWAYDDLRQADSPAGILRVSCLSAPALARLEIRDAALAAELTSRCVRLTENRLGGRAITKIVGWSVAAVASIVMVVLFGIPLAADRLAPLVPEAFEQRLGEASDLQIKAIFGANICNRAGGQAAFVKLLTELRQAAGLNTDVQSTVLATDVPNAFALPGGKVYLFSGLLAKAQNADEIAGVLAHELGHLKHRDNMRGMIYNGGSSFLIGLLFGDVTGSGALIFASRSLITASYSREAEQNADTMTIEVMHKLGRSPKPMGELLYRVTGKEGGHNLSILASHPLTEDRLQRMSAEDRPASGPPLLTDKEWAALKAICSAEKK
ncbi:MAG TPA: M48 family metallopeptidase [Bradyrhizobium sp.]|uniref:M48 family metallopeptidase n=1 Tax=Bradyrhizobium sp. TaxID=376 RepID=UPI002BD64F3B|nr:M48 family metallopeptidase [Bradyrhizobium sp.]HLZ01794.1 M48 family metallopeptidase [Bradyrhizobium sp.]